MGYEGMPISVQATTFLYAILLGAVLSVIYDVFRITRIAFGGRKTAVFIEDLLFSLVALVLTFVFVISFNHGELRFFVLLGELLGFVVCHITIGRIVIILSRTIIKAIKTVLGAIFRPLIRISKRFITKMKQIKKKLIKNRKKPLEIPQENVV